MAEEIKKEFMVSDLTVTGTDWEELSKFIAMNLTPEEISSRGLAKLAAQLLSQEKHWVPITKMNSNTGNGKYQTSHRLHRNSD